MYHISDNNKRTAVYAALTARTRRFKNRVQFGRYELKEKPGTEELEARAGELVTINPVANKNFKAIITELPFKEEGYSTITLTRCGKNILDLRGRLSNANGITVEENADGTFTFNGAPKKDYSAFTAIEFPTKNATYTISQINYADAWNKGIVLTEQNLFDDGTFKNYFAALKAETFTRTSNGRWIAIISNEERKGSPLFVNYKNGYQMEVGAEVTPYEKYKGDTYTASFPKKVYKGSYNWTTGELEGFEDKELQKPYKTVLTPQTIKTLSGVNNLYSSEGETKAYYSAVGKALSFVVEKAVESISSKIVQEANGNSHGITMGNACSSSFSAELNNDDLNYDFSNKIIHPECGIVLADGTTEYLPLGFFQIVKATTTTNGKKYSVEAYDAIHFMKDKWFPSFLIDNNSTLFDVVQDLANRKGLVLALEAENIKNELKAHKLSECKILENYTDEQILGYCAGCVGCNAHINTVGELFIGWFKEYDTRANKVPAEIQYENGFKKESQLFKLESVTSGIDKNVSTAGTGTGIKFSNPFIKKSEIQNIYNRVGGSVWQPSSCDWRGNPCVEAGDIITVTDKNGKSYKVFVATHEITLSGGLRAKIKCSGASKNISFNTLEGVREEIKEVQNGLLIALAEAAGAINGANGGYFKVLGEENRPYGWQCMNTNGLDGVRCTYGGVGCTTDGGKTYKTALTSKGVVADMITIGRIRGPKSTFFIDMETGESSFSNMKATGVFTALGKNYNLKVSNHTFYPGDEIMEHDSLGLYKYDKSGNLDSAICFEDWTKERDPGISLITPKASAHLLQGGCVLTDDSNEAGDSSWKNRVLLSLSKKPSVFNTGIKTGYDSDYVENAIDHMYGHWRKDNMGSEYINDSKITVSRKIQGSNSCPALDLKVEHVIYEQMGGLSPGEEVSAEMVLYTSDTNYKDPQTGSNANTISLGLYSCGVEIGHFTANRSGSLYWNGKKIV